MAAQASRRSLDQLRLGAEPSTCSPRARNERLLLPGRSGARYTPVAPGMRRPGDEAPRMLLTARHHHRGTAVKRAWQIACLAFAAFAVLTLALSTQYAYRDRLGPGPAFFPVWMSVITAVLSLALLVQTTVGRAVATSSAPLRPDRPGALRILAILAALVGSVALLDPLGFRLSLFLFLIFLPPALGARNWWFTVVFALAGSFGVFHVFYYWLKVPLPVGFLGL